MINITSLLDKLREQGAVIATAESCTGGMIASRITDVAGSSDVFERGFVTYSNQAKIDMLGVSAETLKSHGAVSAETAAEMAQGALKNSTANIAISTTGIAGPTGGSDEKPVGLVYISILQYANIVTEKCEFSGNRDEVRKQTVDKAFELLSSGF